MGKPKAVKAVQRTKENDQTVKETDDDKIEDMSTEMDKNLTEKVTTRSKRKMAESGREERPLPKQKKSKGGENTPKRQQRNVIENQIEKQQQSENNNAQIDLVEEPVVGTSKSLINLIKRKHQRESEESSDYEYKTNVETPKRGKQNTRKRSEITKPPRKSKGSYSTKVYTSDESDSDQGRIRVHVKRGERAEFGEDSEEEGEYTSNDSFDSESDPDVEKFDKPRHRNTVSSDSEVCDSEEDQVERRSRRSQTPVTSSDPNSSSGSDSNASTSADERDMRMMKKDPKVRRLLNVMVQEECTKYKKDRKYRRFKEKQRAKREKAQRRAERAEEKRKNRRSKSRSKGIVKNRDTRKNFEMKSPSDTTVYMPALKRNKLARTETAVIDSHGKPIDQNTPISSVIDKISNFVDRMRIQATPTGRREDFGRTHEEGNREPRSESSQSRSGESHRERNRETEKLILEAEKFKASVNAPTGKNDQELQISNEGFDQAAREGFASENNTLSEIAKYLKEIAKNGADDDDQFFHVSCHVDATLKSKIERGEYVDLEKLIPKNRSQMLSDDRRLQIVQRDGETFIGTSEKETKINSIRKWDQAFRIYAAIYSEANPTKSAEIWQYIHVINTAASSYIWENVAYYDTVFRQLMAKKPGRSWAKTYTQLWNIAMCEPIHKNSNNFASTHNERNPENAKNKACWRYNKGKCKRWNCKWEHKCSFCGSFSHVYHTCNKRKNSQEKKGGSSKQQNGSPTKSKSHAGK